MQLTIDASNSNIKAGGGLTHLKEFLAIDAPGKAKIRILSENIAKSKKDLISEINPNNTQVVSGIYPNKFSAVIFGFKGNSGFSFGIISEPFRDDTYKLFPKFIYAFFRMFSSRKKIKSVLAIGRKQKVNLEFLVSLQKNMPIWFFHRWNQERKSTRVENKQERKSQNYFRWIFHRKERT